MKVLVIGGSGLFGQQLVSILNGEKEANVFATYQSKKIEKDFFYKLDITKKEKTYKFLEKIQPDVVVLTAAFTHVDKCETNKKTSFEINVKGTENVAEACNSLGVKLVYISTDYVFDGKNGDYTETDETNPVGYYGYTKLKGEKRVQTFCSDYVIARTSVIYGVHKPNFVTWVISQLKEKKKISIVTDQIISPTYTLDLSEQVYELIKNDATGIFHTAGGEQVSRFDFTKKIASVFDLDESLISPILMKDLNWVAPRPKNSSLNVSKIAEFKKPYSIKESLQKLKEDISGVEG